MTWPEGLELRPARQDERPLIEALFQFYVHDFSEQWADRPDEGELRADGTFEPYGHIADYWRDPTREPLVMHRRGHPVGFALINAISHMTRPVDHAVAEFFVVRKHRRAGVGLAAARQIFSARPGSWEVAVARANLSALAFWRRAIGGCAGVGALETLERDDRDWKGWIFRFRVAG